MCVVEGCTAKGRNKGFYKGKKRYDKYCEYHHRLRYGTQNRTPFNYRKEFVNDKCSRCGWNKSYCDRHRIDPAKGYIEGNVIILCPNCHRIEESIKMYSKIK